MDPTQQQQRIIVHDPREHGRIVAGPGTGKSWTSVALLERLSEEYSGLRVKLLTFTRAATADISESVAGADVTGIELDTPSTIHSFALQILRQHSDGGSFPAPIRLADDWEKKNLIHPHLSKQLRENGWPRVDVRIIKRLEEEMASAWESLDPEYRSVSEDFPGLRSAFVGLWQEHRTFFGYVLLSELPYLCCRILEDFEPDSAETDVLIVDEFQDLNNADIQMVALLSRTGTRVLAIGDDDQSIYGFRMAAPEGIREFVERFDVGSNRDYSLTECLRCRPAILEAASTLIEASPRRVPRPRLTAISSDDNPGTYAYLRFRSGESEAVGVAQLVASRIDAGVSPDEIAILVRSRADNWVRAISPALEQCGIKLMTTAWVEDALQSIELRRAMAIGRLALDWSDSLSWWTLIQLESGVNSQRFVEYLHEARAASESFAQTLLRCYPDFSGAPSQRSAGAVQKLIARLRMLVETLDTEGADLDETGWGGWLLNITDKGGSQINVERLLTTVGKHIPPERGLGYFIGQLDPTGKDLAAAHADAVRLMTLTKSKGLTFDTVFILGVENGMIPFPRGEIEEERRLLYVGITRAKSVCILTSASRRRGPIARQGTPNVNRTRGRTPLFLGLPELDSWRNGEQFVEEWCSTQQ